MLSKEQIHKARIIIVDDQKLHSFFLQKVLKQEGYENIKCVMDPLKVIQTIFDFKPDLLILDLIMPHLDGFQIMEQLNGYRDEHFMPILTLSAEKSSDLRLHAYQSGATDFLNKPFENIEMLSRIQSLIVTRLLHVAVEDQNNLLEVKVQERTKELLDTQLDIINRLAQAAEFRDNDTGMHITRMGQFCSQFGKILGMSDEDCGLLLNAGPLHDVGKIGIPDSILLKPASLTDAEFEMMKTHTSIGAQLLAGSNSPIMRMAQKIALTHHEKWDGNGYPNSLRGDEIPLVGQVSSICDVFDALTSVRPYKKAWTIEEATREIVAQKGEQFNPDIVDKFIEFLPEFKKIKEEYSS